VRVIPGQCHCGNITYEFTWPTDEEKLPARACSCSFCVKHGGVYTSHPAGRLDITLAEPKCVRRYRFGQKSADFMICTECGVIVVAVSKIDGKDYAVVNVNTFETLGPGDMERAVTNFDGENRSTRLARRQRNWTGDVRIRP